MKVAAASALVCLVSPWALAGCERGAGPTAPPRTEGGEADSIVSVATLDARGCADRAMPARGDDLPVTDQPRDETHGLAREAAMRWREEAGDLWQFCVEDEQRYGLVEREAWLCEGGPARAEAWTIRGPGLVLRLTFTCAEPGDGPDAFPGGEVGAYLDEFWPYEPVPDWAMTTQTPSSSVEGEVRVRALGAGMFEATVAAPLLAVYGHSSTADCEPMADAGSEPGCFISIERRSTLGLTIRLPMIPARTTSP